MESTHQKGGALLKGIIALALIAAVSIGVIVYTNEKESYTAVATPPNPDLMPATSTDDQQNSSSTAPISTTSPATVPPEKTASIYKDGTYTADGSYNSPGGFDTVTVSLTLANDIVTDATVTPSPSNDRTSMHYEGIFIANFKPYVIGKDVSTLNLTKVSGSSLTSAGFNAALAKIEVQAKA